MADRTVTVRLEADVAGFVADVGGKAVAAVELLNAAAKKANANLNKLGADSKIGKVTASAATAGADLDRLGTKAAAAGQKVSKVGDGAQAASKKIGASAKAAGVEVDKAGKEIDASLGKATEKIKKTSEKAGSDSGKSFGAGMKKWMVGDGSNIFKEMGKNSGNGFMGALTGALKTPILGPILLAALAAVVAIAAPAAGALAGAGLVAGIGGGIAGLGLMFAAQSDAVGKKWSTTMSSLGEDMKLLSKPFESTLINIATSFNRTVDRFNPALSKAFSSMAVPVGNFADDFAHSLEGLIPAIGPITAAFNAALAAMGGALPGAIGQISDALTKLSLSVSQNPQALADMVTGLGDIIGVTIGLITSLNNINTAFSTMTGGISLVDLALGSVSSTILILQGAFAPLGAVIGGVNALLGRTGKDSDTAGQAMSDAASKTSELATALGGTGDAAQHAGPPILSAAEALQASKKAAADAAAALQEYITKLFQLPNMLLSVRDSQRGVQAAIDDATKSLKDNGRTLDIHTAKGRANQASLDAIITSANKQSEAYVRANASQKTMTAGAAEARTALVKSAVGMGMSRAAAKAMADQYIKTPTAVATDFTNNADGKPKTDAQNYADVLRGTLPAVNTIITNNGAGTPKTNAERYRELLGLVPRAVPTVVTNTAPVAQSKVNQYRTVLGLVPQSKSTSVSTPGAATSQGQVSGLLGLLGALPASKSTNVYTNMIQTTTYKTVGVNAPPPTPVKADGGFHPGGYPSYADGKLPGQAMVAPGKGRGLVQWAEQETGGEAFIPLAPSKRDRSEMILGQVANSFGMTLVRSFADGGFLPGGKLVDIAFLLRQLGIPFNPSAGVNYGSTLKAQNTANAAVGGARTSANSAAAAEAAAKAEVARLQRSITLQQRYVTQLRQGGASQAKIKAEQKDTIALQDQLYRSKQRLTVATNNSNRADATLKLRQEAAAKATEAHKVAVEKLIEQQKAAVDMAAQISTGLQQGANIGDLFQNSLTGKGLLSDLQAQGKQTGTFRVQIDKLRKLGLSETLIQQLVGKGSDQGGQAAQAIIDGGSSLIAALNKAQKALETQANLIGAGSATKKFGQTISGARAGGGDVMAGKTYQVNERGQEYFTAPVNGQIVPAGVDPRRYINGGNGWGGGGTTTVEHHYHQTNKFSGVDYTTADVIAQRSAAKQQLMGRY